MTIDSLALNNVLLSSLLGLLAFFGVTIFKKVERLIERLEEFGLKILGQSKDIDYLRKDVDDHENRITTLETHHARKN